MRHHARRLVGVLAAAALLGAPAVPASAVQVRIDVTNAAAPTVRIVTPADGARIVAGTTVAVRVEGEGADTLSMAVDARPRWSGPGDVLAGDWSPGAGRYRLTAVAARPGAPEAVAVSDVVVVPPADDSNAVAPATPGPAPGPPAGPPAVRPEPSPSTPGARGGGPPASAPRAPRAVAGPVAVATPPAAGTPRPGGAGLAPLAAAEAPAAGEGTPGSASPASALVRAIGRILSSPERVAWVVAFPLLLVLAALAYALLQRFIDGGPKLAWRGRGRSDDQVIEF